MESKKKPNISLNNLENRVIELETKLKMVENFMEDTKQNTRKTYRWVLGLFGTIVGSSSSLLLTLILYFNSALSDLKTTMYEKNIELYKNKGTSSPIKSDEQKLVLRKMK